MSAPAPPVATSRAPAASSQPPAAPSRPSAATSRPPVASSRPLAATTPAVTTPAAATPAPTILEPTIPLTTRSSASHRPRTSTSTSPPTSTVTPYDASSDRRATTQRTNKILAGIFSTLGLIFLSLVLFQLYRRHKRRRKNTIPLPPPRKQSMSQVRYRNSRMVSMYGDYPTQDFSRPPSVLVHMDKSFGSRSAFAVTPSIHSNAASTDVLGTEEVVKKNAELLARPGHVAQESSSDNSISGPAMPLNDEEAGRQLSPLGSRSQSPTNGAPSRPASQLYAYPRPESRTRLARPSSVASTSRQSYLNTGSRQHGSQRHSSYGAANRNSYYATGNYGAPHSPHVRDRVGLVMPQPLAPELFNYALVGRHDMGLDFMQGAWGSQGSLAQASSDHNLAPPRRARTDSWVARGQHTPRSESPLASAKPLSAPEDGSEPRGRSAHPEVPRP